MTWFRNTAIAAALVLAIGGGTYAIAASSGGRVIHGCYQKRAGSLRIISGGKRCKKSERAISWNQKGVQGPRGTPGQQGPKGDPGTPADTSQFYTKSQSDARFLGAGATAMNANAVGGLTPSILVQGGGHVIQGSITGAPTTLDTVVIAIPGIGDVEFDCAANGVDTTPKIVNSSGGTLADMGTVTDNSGTSQDPVGPSVSNGGTLTLQGRQRGTQTVQLWVAASGTAASKTATIVISNVFCFYTATAITNQ